MVQRMEFMGMQVSAISNPVTPTAQWDWANMFSLVNHKQSLALDNRSESGDLWPTFYQLNNPPRSKHPRTSLNIKQSSKPAPRPVHLIQDCYSYSGDLVGQDVRIGWTEFPAFWNPTQTLRPVSSASKDTHQQLKVKPISDDEGRRLPVVSFKPQSQFEPSYIPSPCKKTSWPCFWIEPAASISRHDVKLVSTYSEIWLMLTSG